MNELTDKELQAVLYLVKARLRYESRRKSKPVEGKGDMQSLKVWQLSDIVEKLEKEMLSR